MTQLQVNLPERMSGVEAELRRLIEHRVASRVFEKDASLWGESARAEAAIRLGWTTVSDAAETLIPQIESLRSEFLTQGVDRFVLCGMGGSSLAPAVITRWAGVPLVVLDSTHPDTVREALSGDLSRTAVIVSSKSGSTIETRSQLLAFEQAFADAGVEPASRIVVVTDPGSALDVESQELGRRVFHADPEVGGRFSALTAFGLVPSGLAGADTRQLVRGAVAARDALSKDSNENPALLLAAALAASLPDRYVVAVASGAESEWGLGSWIEQLIAESTGKNGVGVLPIALPATAPEFSRVPMNCLLLEVNGAEHAARSTTDRVAVSGDLGAQFLLWEVATAALGHLMSIDPFNQPDVESAKVAARTALATATPPEHTVGRQFDADALLAELDALVSPGGYVALQAFVNPHADYAASLHELRDKLAARTGVPVALGWGPSYLHSTGQFHKGGPALGTFVQLIDPTAGPLPIPGAQHGFETLILAQAEGDRAVLEAKGLPVLVIETASPEDAVRALLERL